MDELSNRVPKVVASELALFSHHFSRKHEADEEREARTTGKGANK